jgi:hypothetical protein
MERWSQKLDQHVIILIQHPWPNISKTKSLRLFDAWHGSRSRHCRAARLRLASWNVGLVRSLTATDTPCLHLREFTPELVALRFSSHVLSLHFKRLAPLLLEMGQNSGRDLTGVSRCVWAKSEKSAALRNPERSKDSSVYSEVCIYRTFCNDAHMIIMQVINFSANELVDNLAVICMARESPALEPWTLGVVFIRGPNSSLLWLNSISTIISRRFFSESCVN